MIQTGWLHLFVFLFMLIYFMLETAWLHLFVAPFVLILLMLETGWWQLFVGLFLLNLFHDSNRWLHLSVTLLLASVRSSCFFSEKNSSSIHFIIYLKEENNLFPLPTGIGPLPQDESISQESLPLPADSCRNAM